MRTGARRRRGTTLAELMIAVIFLAVCTSAILGCVWNSQTQGQYANHRSAVLAALQAQIYGLRTSARSGALTVGTTSTSTNVAGIGSVTVSTNVTAWAGYTDLFVVSVSASWDESQAGNTRTDTLSITTAVRAPDA